MGIPEFLQEVDRLARMQSAQLDHRARPAADLPYGGLGAFTIQLLCAARGDAFEGADSPTVQVLEVERNHSSTRWRFTTRPLHGASTGEVVEEAAEAPIGGVVEAHQPPSSTRRQRRTEQPEAA
jgi:hypothetical protein